MAAHHMMNEATMIRTATELGIATVTLDRPQSRNALSGQLIRELRTKMHRLDADPDIRVIVLTGAGSAFCAGLDLVELRTTAENLTESAGGPGRPWAEGNTPVIAAVNGPAYTGGLEIVLHCDIVIAAPSAVFADTHVRVGVMPGWGMSFLLPAAIGEYPARAMGLTGRPIDAMTAHRLGLVHEVVDDNQLLSRAKEIAADIALSEPASVTNILRVQRETAGLGRKEAYEAEAHLEHLGAITPDTRPSERGKL